MDEAIQDFLRAAPGLSAIEILNHYRKNYDNQIKADTVYMRLRKLKRRGVVINKGGRWYLNTNLNCVC